MVYIKKDMNIKNKLDEIFNKAENFRKDGEIAKALSSYNEFLNVGEMVNDCSRHHEAYWGMCLTWYLHSRNCNKWHTLIEYLYDMTMVYAPIEKKEEYSKFYNDNMLHFKEEVTS